MTRKVTGVLVPSLKRTTEVVNTIEQLYSIRLVDCPGWSSLSTRTRRMLRACDCFFLGDLIFETPQGILRIPNLGKGSLKELEVFLKNMGLNFQDREIFCLKFSSSLQNKITRLFDISYYLPISTEDLAYMPSGYWDHYRTVDLERLVKRLNAVGFHTVGDLNEFIKPLWQTVRDSEKLEETKGFYRNKFSIFTKYELSVVVQFVNGYGMHQSDYFKKILQDMGRVDHLV